MDVIIDQSLLEEYEELYFRLWLMDELNIQNEESKKAIRKYIRQKI